MTGWHGDLQPVALTGALLQLAGVTGLALQVARALRAAAKDRLGRKPGATVRVSSMRMAVGPPDLTQLSEQERHAYYNHELTTRVQQLENRAAATQQELEAAQQDIAKSKRLDWLTIGSTVSVAIGTLLPALFTDQ